MAKAEEKKVYTAEEIEFDMAVIDEAIEKDFNSEK